jgi:hypothetical protein
MEFIEGRDYTNVYFMSVDAKDHSSIVARNDADKVDRAFDGFEALVYRAVDEAKAESRCQYTEFWGWAGDGGLCIFYDDSESRARTTALLAAEEILKELPHFNTRLTRASINGELAVRIAIHKGSFKYKGDARRGSIHSRDLNFCAHLQKVVPTNCAGISEDLFQLLGSHQANYFAAEEEYEGRRVYLMSDREQAEVQAEWQENTARAAKRTPHLRSDIDIAELGLVGVYSQRALTETFRDLFAPLARRLWVMGIGLGGFRADHEESVKELAEKGVSVRLLALDPERSYAELRLKGSRISLPAWCDREGQTGYNAATSGTISSWVKDVNADLVSRGCSNPIQLRFYSIVPTAAMLIADDAVFVSPFAGTTNNVKLFTLEFVAGRRLGRQSTERFERVWSSNELSRDASGTID